MNHYYVVTAIIRGSSTNYRKHFKTRDRANNFVYKLLVANNLEVNDIRRISKHVEEDYCDSLNKFIIARV